MMYIENLNHYTLYLIFQKMITKFR